MPLSPRVLVQAWKLARYYQHPWANDDARALLDTWHREGRLPGWPLGPTARHVTTDVWYAQLCATVPRDVAASADPRRLYPWIMAGRTKIQCDVEPVRWSVFGLDRVVCVNLRAGDARDGTAVFASTLHNGTAWFASIDLCAGDAVTENLRDALGHLVRVLRVLVEDPVALDALLAESLHGPLLDVARGAL